MEQQKEDIEVKRSKESTEEKLTKKRSTEEKLTKKESKEKADNLETKELSGKRKSNDILKDAKTESKKEKVNERGVWGNRLEFLLACIGNMVGLGNIWRFPYLVYKYGGGAFLFPYLVCLFVVGIPVLFVEIALGQFSQSGPGHLFQRIVPLFKGLGLCAVVTAAFLASYYNIIITWIVYYFFMSFSGIIGTCNPKNGTKGWSTKKCIELKDLKGGAAPSNRTAAAEEFFELYMLEKGKNINDWSWPSWGLFLCLVVASGITAIILIYGIQSSGKVVYFTATFPYVTLTILLIRGLTLDGAFTGLKFYLMPSFSRVADFTVWREAMSQVCFSMGIGMGVMITLGSYNKFHNRLVTDILILGFGDLFSSLFAGAVVFSMVGYVAKTLNKEVDKTVKDGRGLVFIVLVEGIVNMPLGVIWIITFTLTLFLLGIDSMFNFVETCTTFVYDYIIDSGRKPKKPIVAGFVFVILIAVGLPMITSAGIYVFDLIDTFTNALPLLFIGACECIVVNIYGVNRFLDDLNYMTGTNFPKALRICARISLILSPLFLIYLLVLEIKKLAMETSEGKVGGAKYPVWAIICGWLLAVIPIAFVPIGMINHFIRAKDKSCRVAITATEEYRVKALEYGSYKDKK